MEETKLLRILILIIFSSFSGLFSSVSNIALAQESDLDWARGIAERDTGMVMDNFKEIINQPGFDPKLKEKAFKPRPVLQIFVSSSNTNIAGSLHLF